LIEAKNKVSGDPKDMTNSMIVQSLNEIATHILAEVRHRLGHSIYHSFNKKVELYVQQAPHEINIALGQEEIS
jgi:hypothetical protein